MTFLTPLLAGIAAAVAVPSLIILYFLKLRRRDVEISSTLLWKKTIQDLQANAPFQKLRRNILLLLQLLILAAALFALAQPQIAGDTTTGDRHVILIDRSASMSAMDGGPSGGPAKTRLEKAKEDALALIESLRTPGLLGGAQADEAMVIAFGSSAEVRQAFTSDKTLLRAAIEGIEPIDTPTSLKDAAALVLAQAPRQIYIDADNENMIHDRPPGRIGTIHVWSDGRVPDAGEITFGPEDTVVYYPIGSGDAPNVGITSLRAQRAYNDPNELSIFVGLTSTAREARDVDVELLIDGVPTRIESVRLPAAEKPGVEADAGGEATTARWTPANGGVVFKMTRIAGGVIAVRIRQRGGAVDTLSADDLAWVVVPPAKLMSVAVVTRGNLFIRDALAALPLAKLDVLTPEQFQARLDTLAAGEYDVVVLDRWLPRAPSEEEALPPGRFLIFGAVPTSPRALIDRGEVDRVSVPLTWSRDHPVLRPVSLDHLVIFKSRLVEPGPTSSARVLAAADTGPMLVELSTAESMALVLPFDPLESNWVFNVSWVIFLGSAVQYLGEAGSSGIGRMIQPGEILSDRLPAGAANARVALPGGGEANLLPAPDGRVVFGPVLNSGVYMLSWQGQAGATDVEVGGRVRRPFAANLLDAAETDIPVTESLAIASKAATATADAAASRTRKDIWPWLLVGALVVMLLEWFIYNRKVHL